MGREQDKKITSGKISIKMFLKEESYLKFSKFSRQSRIYKNSLTSLHKEFSRILGNNPKREFLSSEFYFFKRDIHRTHMNAKYGMKINRISFVFL